MEKLIVDQDLCIGCGACVNVCDEVFDFTEEGNTAMAIENNNVVEKLEKDVKDNALDALDSCPVNAIKLVNEKEEKPE